MSTTVFTDVNAHITFNGSSDSVNEKVLGKKLGIFTRVLGCQHRNLSRPFSQGRSGYRACINCGSRQQFNPRTLETHGAFYAAPVAGEATHHV
jgi:hypothetical protein